MGNLLEDLKKLEEDTDAVARGYLETQVKCIMLHYAGVLVAESGYGENGAFIMDSVKEIRDGLDGLWKTMQTIPAQNLEQAYERIGYDKIFYSSLSDEAIAASAPFFTIKPRPEGSDFACDEAAFLQKTDQFAYEFFGGFYGQAV